MNKYAEEMDAALSVINNECGYFTNDVDKERIYMPLRLSRCLDALGKRIFDGYKRAGEEREWHRANFYLQQRLIRDGLAP